ncbi:MAG: UDP-N-acetyl-D-mannosamine dehydrogenase [Burkholderiales bacterium]|nr:UDP-N-acetyl-D-mannosamine dehydrogenase [Burkholderiales bacterium]
MKISVIGLGYVGLPTAAIFAQSKVEVIGVDIIPHVIDTINHGEIHIVEPGLEKIVKTAIREGYLRATSAPEHADAFLIAVPTPFKDNYVPDISYIKSAALMIAPFLQKGNIVILESTSPVGTTEQMVAWLSELRPDLSFPTSGDSESDVHIAYCPERVLPGKVIEELVRNDRVVGGVTPKCALLAEKVYRVFVKGAFLHTNVRTAEMTKLAENSFRDVNIAFANELSMICDKLDINVWELIKLANHHPRVNILQPGSGVGGHCIAVDPWFIVNKTPEEARLIKVARIVNDSKPEWVINKVNAKVVEFLQNNPDRKITDVKIACFGLTFKPDIDDVRESPAMKIVSKLANTYFGNVYAIDSHITRLPQNISNLSVKLIDIKEVFHIADIFVLLVNHKSFNKVREDLLLSNSTVDVVGCLY